MHTTGQSAERAAASAPKLVSRIIPLRQHMPTCSAGYIVGLRAAELMRLHFPEFYAAHVAGANVTTGRLIGVVHAFLELMHEHRIEYHTEYTDNLVVIGCGVPAEDIVNGYSDSNDDTLPLVWDILASWIDSPLLQYYGLGTAGESWLPNGNGENEHMLAMAMWRITNRTEWTFPFASESFALCDVTWRRRIERLPRLPADTNMDRLVCSATWRCDLPGIGWHWTIGDVIAYVCATTGNFFADYAMDEMDGDDNYGIHENIERLQAISQRQQQARQLCDVYHALDNRVREKPSLLTHIARALRADALALAEASPGPQPLVDLLVADEYAEEIEI